MDFWKKIKNAFGDAQGQEFEALIRQTAKEETDTYWYYLDVSKKRLYLEKVAVWPAEEKLQFLLHCIARIHETSVKGNYDLMENSNQLNTVRRAYLRQILKDGLRLSEAEAIQLLTAISTGAARSRYNFEDWKIGLLVGQIAKNIADRPVPPALREALTVLKQEVKDDPIGIATERTRATLLNRIEELLFEAKEAGEVRPCLFKEGDEFSAFANPLLQQQPSAARKLWYGIMEQARKASGAKPAQKYLAEAKDRLDALGSAQFKALAHQWFGYIADMEETVVSRDSNYNDQTYTYEVKTFLDVVNGDIVKGLVWMDLLYQDKPSAQVWGRLAERGFRKIPGKGPAAAGIGNACLFALQYACTLEGVAQLSRLRLRVKQANTLALIERYIAAVANQLGVDSEDMEDMAVEDFGLVEGSRTYLLGDVTCQLEVTGMGKSQLRWFKADSSELKSVPASVKTAHAPALRVIKEDQKQINQATSVQRDRFDRMLRSRRMMTLEHFNTYYVAHGLLSLIAKKLIFNFTKGDTSVQAIYSDGAWQTHRGEVVPIADFERVSLWHPVTSSTLEVQQWRSFLMAQTLQQPIKQAFREIYVLTDAEIRTVTYSNRMAAHVLRQHQVISLAKGRGWSMRLMGAWDGGDDDAATLKLPAYGLTAQYFVSTADGNDVINDLGFWIYVITDQVRFLNEAGQPVPLIEVPPTIFSEVMRDVDLFVGVSSVGNDPNWQDSGHLPGQRNYWQNFAFGDLSEVAKNRRELLERLVPRLKIAKVATLEGNYLVVKGKLRTYKIHIGSTNILMSPNDQYLCIVPQRGGKDHTQGVFLPFEGDNGLSVILSKAFLLAEDDRIEDPTIVSQIGRR